MEPTMLSHSEKIQRGSADAWPFFQSMIEFVGFKEDDANAIRESGLVIEKYLPRIVADFYSHLLRYPPTRKHFLKKDGTIDLDYVEKRMHHLTNFWRRSASGVYDEEYARYVDYVGRAHTRHGADPSIYIEERYVIGQVGFIQRAITESLDQELHGYDEELAHRATHAWNLLMIVILEMLARAYREDTEEQLDLTRYTVDGEAVQQMAVDIYERGLGLVRERKKKMVAVAMVEEIPDGERKIVEVDGTSIGVFHHKGGWYALQNHCQHRGGPVAEGRLNGDTLVCPWHGYEYHVTSGALLVDPSVKLDTYPVSLQDGQIFLEVPEAGEQSAFSSFVQTGVSGKSETTVAQPSTPAKQKPEGRPKLEANELYVDEVPQGGVRVVKIKAQRVAVFNVGGNLYATTAACTHKAGPLDQGELVGTLITCPIHGSCFDVTSGAVLKGPATLPLKTYKVEVVGEILRISE